MAAGDYIIHKKVTITADNVAQALSASYEEVWDLNIHSKSDNDEVAYFGNSEIARSGAGEAGVPLYKGQNLPYRYGELSRLFVIGKTDDVFLLSYVARQNGGI